MRLDHLVAKRSKLSERAAREAIASGTVLVDRSAVVENRLEVSKFSEVCIGKVVLQSSTPRVRIRLHKPVGAVSATVDADHPTVLDLIDHPQKASLHLAGRLDRSSSGLVLLTNDSQWSEALTSPTAKVPKGYVIETVDPIPTEAVAAFADGFHLMPENIVTLPAKLELLGERTARVTLHEGKWHQIKRMIHRINRNRLVRLHRESIGDYHVGDLAPGEWDEILD